MVIVLFAHIAEVLVELFTIMVIDVYLVRVNVVDIVSTFTQNSILMPSKIIEGINQRVDKFIWVITFEKFT